MTTPARPFLPISSPLESAVTEYIPSAWRAPTKERLLRKRLTTPKMVGSIYKCSQELIDDVLGDDVGVGEVVARRRVGLVDVRRGLAAADDVAPPPIVLLRVPVGPEGDALAIAVLMLTRVAVGARADSQRADPRARASPRRAQVRRRPRGDVRDLARDTRCREEPASPARKSRPERAREARVSRRAREHMARNRHAARGQCR